LSDHEDWIYGHLAVPSGGVFVDVGGFVGTHAIRIAKDCNARVIVIEPVPAHSLAIEINAVINNVSVQLIKKAAGNFVGEVRFRVDGPGNSKIDDEGHLKVQSSTLDKMLVDEPRIDVIKIDTEGHECAVLDGAVETAARCRPKFIVEVHSHMRGCEENGNAIQMWCANNSYRCDHIWKNSPGYYYVAMTPRS